MAASLARTSTWPMPTQGYPHRRSAQWPSHVPRLQFTQGALYEIGSALRLFQIKSYAEIFAHYEQFDLRRKDLLPLRRIYVPQVLEAD